MKSKVNVIKIREQFRPFAGSILQDHVHDYFEVPENNYYSPFMNYCFTVKKEKRRELAAIVHADNTCRIQTVSRLPVSTDLTGSTDLTDSNLYFKLISEFYYLSGTPCILDTSFNLKGEPIVESLEQAIYDFLNTKMDEVYIESCRILK